MKTLRFLLPFTQPEDACVLDHAVALARRHNATLVLLALVSRLEARRLKGVHPEQLQQIEDFLEVGKQKAMMSGIPVEQWKISTGDVVRSSCMLAQEMGCEDILLFLRSESHLLLQASEVRGIMENTNAPYTLHILRLQAEKRQQPTWLVLERYSAVNRIGGSNRTQAFTSQNMPKTG